MSRQCGTLLKTEVPLRQSSVNLLDLLMETTDGEIAPQICYFLVVCDTLQNRLVSAVGWRPTAYRAEDSYRQRSLEPTRPEVGLYGIQLRVE